MNLLLKQANQIRLDEPRKSVNPNYLSIQNIIISDWADKQQDNDTNLAIMHVVVSFYNVEALVICSINSFINQSI